MNNKSRKVPTINLVIIAGIRAQFMKVAALQRAIQKWNDATSPYICATYVNSGQHYDDDLAGIFIRELDIHFDCDLSSTYQDLRPIRILGDMIVQLYDLLDDISKPIDWVIVFGDANTTMGGAIAAAKRGLPVIHVEAGLRTGNLKSPEEINRIVADHVSTIHFVSSRQDVANLKAEGLTRNVVWTGDLIGDLVKQLSPTLPPSLTGYSPDEYVLSSLHREENLRSDTIMHNVLEALNEYSKRVVFIAHPRTRIKLKELGLYGLKNIDFLDTLPYKQMLSAIKGCAFVVTDSGAFQREAYYLGKRCLIRQDEPFWPSLVQADVHRTIGGDKCNIQLGFRWMEQVLASGEYPTVDDLGDGTAGDTMLRNIAMLTASQAEQQKQK